MSSLNKKSKVVDGYIYRQYYVDGNFLKKRLRHWQHSRSWARLICEAEKMWRLDSKELKRMGAIELTNLHNEMPYSVRKRVNNWIIRFSGATRL